MKNYTFIYLTTFLLILISASSVFAGGDNYPTGSRTAGMGRSSVAITDFWSSMNNQAGIALYKDLTVGIYYENRFLINDLSSKSIAAIIPTKYGVFATTYNHFGYSLYNDQKIGLAYARAFGEKFRIGLQLDYLQTTLGNNYGKKGSFTFEIGVQTEIIKNITIGAWVFNPIMVALAGYDNEKLPAIYRMGFAWNISEEFMVTVEAEKSTAINPVILRGGLEYELNSRFFFRTGFSTNKEIFSFGMGLNLKHLNFNISTIMHESLGFSPQASLIFHF